MTRIYEAQDHLLIHAGYGDPAEHRHRAAQMVFSFSGLMRVRLKNEIQICRGILIPSGVTHAINTGDQPALILLYDCSTGVAKQMQFLKCVPEKICDRIIRSYCAFAQDETPEKYAAFEQTLMEQLGLMKSTGGVTDERIASAMQYVRDMISERPTCQETADHVFLSQGRFSHLFREQTGMTFASYVCYQRLMFVYAQMLKGRSATDSALEAGFSSSAHFADVHRRVFGLAARRIIKDVKFVKIQ